jgi:outer membrane protein with beta-barrel domain
MYRRIVLLTAIIHLFFFTSRAQLLMGIQAGVSSNNLHTSIANRASATINRKDGYTIGMPVQYRINSWLYAAALPDITQKNYSIDRTDSLTGVYEQWSNTYLQLPLMLHFIYGKRLQVFADAGAYIGYWTSGRVKGKTPNVFGVTDIFNPVTGQRTETYPLTAYDEKYNFNNRRDRRFEFGWVAGFGLQYKVRNRYSVYAEVSRYESLTDQQKKYMVNQEPQYNETITLSIGGLYSFK